MIVKPGYAVPEPTFCAEAECVCGATMEAEGTEAFCSYQLGQFIIEHSEHSHFSGEVAAACEVCGCTEYDACIEDDGWPCSWAEFDLSVPVAICSSCGDNPVRGEEM